MLSRPTSIRLEGIGKRYKLGETEPYRTLRDSIVRWLKPVKSAPSVEPQEIWALKNLDLEVKQGEVLGIIGRNGAGKSTLLKLLSRITTPDTGRIEMHGRVGALLEVGTGFHPELSGRENVYMNGAILGMTRRDIDRKFDQIVAFAGVETFLDTPVKRYSSGMRVRLGFAVAAHLEPEILVIDEVLAVGDAEFQRKCLGRMNEVAGEGRTVLFVSHQMEAIQSLCSRVIWLRGGELTRDGEAEEVVNSYLLDTLSLAESQALADRLDRAGDGGIRVTDFKVEGLQGNAAQTGGTARFILDFRTNSKEFEGVPVEVRVGIREGMDRVLTMLGNEMTGEEIRIDADHGRIVCEVKHLPLVPGVYAVDVALRVRGLLQDKVLRAATFEVMPGDFYGAGKIDHVGFFHLQQQWLGSSH